MKSLYLIICFHLFSILLFGAPVDSLKARKAASFFFQSRTKDPHQSESGIQRVDFVRHNILKATAIQPEYYIFNRSDKGYVIIAGDDNIFPVLAYSDESSFNPDNIPSNLREWLAWRQREINYISKNNFFGSNKIKTEWDNLLNERQPSMALATTEILPLVTTSWGQGTNFNRLCPYDSIEEKNVVTGCVATAMAQIMKYWEYPVQGIGTKSYTHPVYGSLTANFGATTYFWDSMPDIVAIPDTFISTLMYHCGVGVSMNYGPSGSTAGIYGGSPSAGYALINYFNYKKSLIAIQRNNYSDSAWISMLKSQLNIRHPLLYVGRGSGSHAFVCDGYTSDNYFHFNWGWNGSGDGFFLVNSLCPGTSDFSFYQGAIFGIGPKLASLAVNPSSIIVSSDTSYIPSFKIASNANWTITGMSDWLFVDSISGSGCSKINTKLLSPNNTGIDRTDTLVITVTGLTPKKVIITQKATSALLPNLKPYRPSTWSDKIVVSNVKSPITDVTDITTTDTTFIAFALTNNGTLPTNGVFYNVMSLDNEQIFQTVRSLSLSNGYYIYSFRNIGNLSFGTHTLTFSVDNSNLLPELNENDNIYSKTFTVYGFSISTNFLEFKAFSESRDTFLLSSNTTWTISNIPEWLSLNTTSGTGNSVIIATAACNPSDSARSDSLVITSKEGVVQYLVISQEAPYLSIAYATNLLEPFANNKEITISSNTDWSVESNQPWLTLGTNKGCNSAIITIYAEDNLTSDDRYATITFNSPGTGSQFINFVQSGKIVSVPVVQNEDIRIYPNPFVDKFYISSPITTGNIEIINTKGEVLLKKSAVPEKINIDLSFVPSGVYFVRIKTKRKVYIRPVVKL